GPKRTNEEAIEHALGPDGEPSDVQDITIFPPEEDKKLTLIRLALRQWWVGPNDARALERCWGSVPYERFAAFVTENTELWDECIRRGADLTELDHYHHLQRDFRADIRATAQQYLTTNEAVIASERDRLGIPADGAAAPPPTAVQDKEL